MDASPEDVAGAGRTCNVGDVTCAGNGSARLTPPRGRCYLPAAEPPFSMSAERMIFQSSSSVVRSAALVTVLLAAACGTEAPGTDAVADATPSIEVARSLGVQNARMPIQSVVTAGQLTEAQFDGLVAAGFKNFISLRLASEGGAGWEESHASTVGATFTRLPIAGSEGLTQANAEELARLLEAAGTEGTVLYCGSSNRVGALLALKAHWVDGASADESLALGRAGGMTRLEPAVVQLLGS